MKTNEKKGNMGLMVGAFVLVGLLSLGAVTAYQMGFGMNWNSGDREAIQTAIENNDYESWKNLMEAGLSEENFNLMVERHDTMQERKNAVESAIDSGDYGAWVSAMNANGKSFGMTEVVTEDNFGTFAEMHKAMEAGDFEKAQELREEIGLTTGSGGCGMHGMGMRF